MVNPSCVGKSGELMRLRTLESIWIQGRLRMWGRWSYIGNGSSDNMFNQLLATEKVSKKALAEALRQMKKSGITRAELESYFQELMDGNHKSHLAFCTDEEAIKVDAVISAVLLRSGHKRLYSLIRRRYIYRESKKAMARDLNRKHTEWCLRTCENRIDVWLSMAESMLYPAMCEAFGKKAGIFPLKSCANSA
ncbi:DUF1133 family protein [Pantoea stewartii]|uniref:DUF1133 family protein n=1 Tax=Pantoea stewartii TaxID=66269 RepID=UPI00138FBCD2|nr:DUF1133 family protein [Pantoea stewartii]